MLFLKQWVLFIAHTQESRFPTQAEIPRSKYVLHPPLNIPSLLLDVVLKIASHSKSSPWLIANHIFYLF